MAFIKNKKRLYIIEIFLLSIFLYKQWDRPKLRCREGFIEEFKAHLKVKYKADSVEFIPTVVQEEIYFEELRSMTVGIYNPTTPIFDFKKYKGEQLEYYDEIIEFLEKEGETLSKIVYNNCSCKGFNNIAIVFLKKYPNRDRDMISLPFGYDNCR